MRSWRSLATPSLGMMVALAGCAGSTAVKPPAPEAAPVVAAPEKKPAGCPFENQSQFCACLGLTCGGDTVADKDGNYHTVYCGTCDPSQVCVAKPTTAGGAAGACAAMQGLAPAQKKIAEQLTSLWENSTPVIDYAYSEDIKDGRGFTSGRAGFCTGTGDAIVVLACYDTVKPGNRMHRHMSALVTLEEKFVRSNGTAHQGDTKPLKGWVADWSAAAADPAFKSCQDGVVDAVYYGIAMQHADRKGFTTALTKAAFYDAQINMGDDNEVFGMRAMIARADQLAGPLSSPPTREEESRWLGHFLKTRAQIMFDDAQTWRSNMYRVANYEKLRKAGNLDLSGCIKTGASAAAMWPGSRFTKDAGPAASLGTCSKIAKL